MKMIKTTWIRNLKVGDSVIVGSFDIGTVKRFTKTQVILESEDKFRISDGKVVGAEAESWHPLQIREATEDRITKIRKKILKGKLLARLKKVDMEAMSIDKLEKILEVAETDE
jgi:hypothetical protein